MSRLPESVAIGLIALLVFSLSFSAGHGYSIGHSGSGLTGQLEHPSLSRIGGDNSTHVAKDSNLAPTHPNLRDAPAASASNMVYGGGQTMHTSITYAIFWLPSGRTFEPILGSDSSYESIIEQFFNDVGGTPYYNILTQYADNVNGAILDGSTFGGAYVDTTPYPASGTRTNPLHDSDIQAEVVRALSATGWTPAPNKIFFVYTAYGIESCSDNANTQCSFNAYCGYHYWFPHNGQTVIYANMPDDGGLRSVAFCPYNLVVFSPNHDFYADDEISITSHELFEAVTDPTVNAWGDPSGNEIGDKCYTSFGNIDILTGSNLVLRGHRYIVQEEWSNYNQGCVLGYGPSSSDLIQLSPAPGSNVGTFMITYTALGSTTWTTTSYSNGMAMVFMDPNSQVTISSISSNSGEEWCLSITCPSLIIRFGPGNYTTPLEYYNLLSQTVSASVSGGGSPSISLTYLTASAQIGPTNNPQTTTVPLSNNPQLIWIMRGSTMSMPAAISGASGERWATVTSAWSVTNPYQTASAVYFHQYSVTFQFSVANGGSGFSPPAVGTYQFGSFVSTLVGESEWVDAGSSFVYTNPLGGSGGNERWYATGSTATLTAPAMVIPVYYHQYQATFGYSVIGGGNPTAPLLTAAFLGATQAVSLPPSSETSPVRMFLDAGSSYSLSNPLPNSGPDQRWASQSLLSGVVIGPLILSPGFYHQYAVQLSYSVVGGGQPAVPNFSYVTFGSGVSIMPSATIQHIWADSGSQYSIPSTLGGSTPSERWSTSNTGGTVSAPVSIAPIYRHQFFLTIIGGGQASQWLDAGTTATITTSESFGRSNGQGFRISSYSIDSGPVTNVPVSSTVNAIVMMNAPHTLTLNSVTQYVVTLDANAFSAFNYITPPTIPGDSYWYDSGSSVNLVLNGVWNRVSGSGFRLVSFSVNGGGQTFVAATKPITILSIGSLTSPQSVSATSVAQFFLNTSVGSLNSITPPPVSGDRGWYDAGTVIKAIYNYIWNATSQARLNAVAYNIDATQNTMLSRSGDGTFMVSIRLDKPHQIVVDSSVQYRLTTSGGSNVTLSTQSPTKDGFFDAGSSLTATTDYTWDVLPNVSRQNLIGYTLDGTTKNVPRAEFGNFMTPAIIFDTYHSLTFNPITQFFVSFSFTDASGAKAITPTSLRIDVKGAGVQDVPGFKLWLDNGTSFHIASLLGEGVDVRPSNATTYQVRGAMNPSIHARIYDATLKVTDYVGLGVSGARADITLANGTKISRVAGPDGTIFIPQIPRGTFNATVDNLGVTTKVLGDASTHTVTTVNAPLSYPTLGIIVIAIAGVLGGIFFLRRSRVRASSSIRSPTQPARYTGLPAVPTPSGLCS